MYYQVYFKQNLGSKRVQESLDNRQELQERVIEKNYPKHMEIHYFNQDGLIGIGFQYYHFLDQCYKTYKKIKA